MSHLLATMERAGDNLLVEETLARTGDHESPLEAGASAAGGALSFSLRTGATRRGRPSARQLRAPRTRALRAATRSLTVPDTSTPRDAPRPPRGPRCARRSGRTLGPTCSHSPALGGEQTAALPAVVDVAHVEGVWRGPARLRTCPRRRSRAAHLDRYRLGIPGASPAADTEKAADLGLVVERVWEGAPRSAGPLEAAERRTLGQRSRQAQVGGDHAGPDVDAQQLAVEPERGIDGAVPVRRRGCRRASGAADSCRCAGCRGRAGWADPPPRTKIR